MMRSGVVLADKDWIKRGPSQIARIYDNSATANGATFVYANDKAAFDTLVYVSASLSRNQISSSIEGLLTLKSSFTQIKAGRVDDEVRHDHQRELFDCCCPCIRDGGQEQGQRVYDPRQGGKRRNREACRAGYLWNSECNVDHVRLGGLLSSPHPGIFPRLTLTL